MPLPRFELQSDTCNAAEAVRGALGFTAGNASALDFGAASGGECGALAAASPRFPRKPHAGNCAENSFSEETGNPFLLNNELIGSMMQYHVIFC